MKIQDSQHATGFVHPDWIRKPDAFQGSLASAGARALPQASIQDSVQFGLRFRPKKVESYKDIMEAAKGDARIQWHFLKLKLRKSIFRRKSYNVEKQSVALSNKLWNRVFKPLVKDPVKARALSENWEREIKEDFSDPLMQSLATAMAKSLNDPPTLRRLVDLFSHVLMDGGMARIEAAGKSGNGSLASVLQDVDKAFVQGIHEKTWKLLVQPTLSEIDPKRAKAFSEIVGDILKANVSDPALQSLLVLMSHGLQKPDVLNRFATLTDQVLRDGGYDEFERVLAAHKKPGDSPATRIETILKNMDRPFIKSIYEKTWDTLLSPTFAEMDKLSRERVHQQLREELENPMLREVATVLVNLMPHQKELRRASDLIYEFLDEGNGFRRLNEIAQKTQTPAFKRLPPERQGQWILNALGPDFRNNIANKLWDDVIQPWLNNPERAAQMLDHWSSLVDAQIDQPMIKGSAKLFLTHAKNNLHRETQNIRKLYDLMWQVMAVGGYKKAENLIRVIQSDDFKVAEPARQGQLLLEGLGPLFIKAFQTLSTINGLFPPQIQESMVKLYEDITPISADEIKRIVHRELGKPFEEAFLEFDIEPLKVGSIAQVHKAKVLIEYPVRHVEDVIVKIVKDGTEESIDEDFDLLLPLVDVAQTLAPNFDVKDLFKNFRNDVKNECYMSREPESSKDAGGEAQRLIRMREVLKDIENVVVPKVIESHTRPKLLTMTFCKGKSLNYFKGDSEVAQRFMNLMMEQIFMRGACQADPHPGNILYDPQSKQFAFIDGGLFYFISKEERVNFAKVLVGLISQNTDLICETVLKDGMANHKNYPEFKRRMADKTPDPKTMNEASTMKFLAAVTVEAQQLGMQINEINPLLWKSLFTTLMVARTIDPNVNITMPAVMRLPVMLFNTTNLSFKFKSVTSILGKQIEPITGGVKKRADEAIQSVRRILGRGGKK